MLHHYHLAVLRLPSSVERELALLQSEAFRITGAISSQAVPPLIPLAALTAEVTSAELVEVVPAWLRTAVTLTEVQRCGPALCMATGLSDHPVETAPADPRLTRLPEPFHSARARVYLAGPDSVLPPDDRPKRHNDQPDSVVVALERMWSEPQGGQRPEMTVRSAWVELWEMWSEATPWWHAVNWSVLERFRSR